MDTIANSQKRGHADQQETTLASPSRPGKKPRLDRGKDDGQSSSAVMLDINQVLPTEILRIILVDDLDARYDHVYVGRVCRAWRDITASKKEPVRSTSGRWVTFMEDAAFYGHLAIIRWALSEGCPRVGWVANRAAAGGHLDLLDYLYSIGWCYRNTHLCDGAARGGHWHVMSWARDKNYPWGEWTCANAAKGGHLEMLQWLRGNGCPWDRWTCIYAAEGGHLDVLQWARSNGCPWDEWACSGAAKGGHLEVLQWLRANDCPWTEYVCSGAAKRGHLALLQWARAHGCPWNCVTTKEAAEHGHLATLAWACENGCDVDYRAWTLAAQGGHLAVLKWLFATYGPRCARECREIAEKSGHRALVRWLDEQAQ
ncbi:Ankyrin repeat domain containing protein [Pandoravirus neocaledonia]|uniref:Ankyrin repeat domain containing protein n=1 Tax=Pandoravirus neocaledonia TaxID=2107708 RepID=A0A2U7UCH9_9VIRU|nr:Ankyrin repeat domain containing protein [Pandoravirus neocaledonia]AVK76102.1 Ankyrin repeat domain containing protein [Pandoravirus neocaledonia]